MKITVDTETRDLTLDDGTTVQTIAASQVITDGLAVWNHDIWALAAVTVAI